MATLINVRLQIAQEISPPLRKLEAGIETVFESSGALMLAIARGRLQAQVPFADGLKAMQQIHNCVGSLIESATEIDELHKTLDGMRRDFNLPPAAVGDYGDKPKIVRELSVLVPAQATQVA